MKTIYVLALGISLSLSVVGFEQTVLANELNSELKATTGVSNDKVPVSAKKGYKAMGDEVSKSKLTKLQSDITEKIKLEKPFENKYWDNKAEGIYVDVISGEPLFLSKDKFDSGTGWPSFTKPIDKNFVINILSNKDGVNKTDVKNSITNSHLGNLYYDGPKDKGGKRYCLYSSSLRFIPKAEMVSEGYGYLLNQVSK